ncbi:MAG: PQQ-binding-like beta-propeller repeat protein [Candidatus Eisenbacteria bacterium]
MSGCVCAVALPAWAGGESAGGEKKVWEKKVGRSLGHGIAREGNSIAVTSLDRHCMLLDRLTGKEIWDQRLDDGIQAGLTIAKGHILGVTDHVNGKLFCLEARRGDMLWSRTLGAAWGAPLVRDGRVYAASKSGTVVAVELDDGSHVWQRRLGVTIRSGLAFAESVLFVPTAEDSLLAFKAEDGERVWGISCGGGLYGPPVVKGGRLWCLTYSGRLLMLDARDGATLAQAHLQASFRSGMVSGEHLYALSTGGTLFAITAGDLSVVWERKLGGAADLCPTVAEDIVWVGLRDGSVHGLRATDGDEVLRLEVCAPVAAPILVDAEMIFVAAGEGKLIAYRWEGRNAARMSDSDRTTGLDVVVSAADASRAGLLDLPGEGGTKIRLRGKAEPGYEGAARLHLVGPGGVESLHPPPPENGSSLAQNKSSPTGPTEAAGAGSNWSTAREPGGGLTRWLYTLGCLVGAGAALRLHAEADEAHAVYETTGDPGRRDAAFDRAQTYDRAVVGAWLASEICFFLGVRAWLKAARGA